MRGIADGLRYAKSRPDLLGTYLIDIGAMFFGAPYAVFPQVAAGLGGPAVLGLLYAAPGFGSMVVSADEQLDQARAPARPGDRAGGLRLGHRDRRLRLRAQPAACRARARGGGRV